METQGSPMPLFINPAEFLLEITSSDFAGGDDQAQARLDKIHADWKASKEASAIRTAIPEEAGEDKEKFALPTNFIEHASASQVVVTLLYRSFIKSYRDVVAYGIRFAMYFGLAIMMGTVWLRLPPTQTSIQPFINAIVSL